MQRADAQHIAAEEAKLIAHQEAQTRAHGEEDYQAAYDREYKKWYKQEYADQLEKFEPLIDDEPGDDAEYDAEKDAAELEAFGLELERQRAEERIAQDKKYREDAFKQLSKAQAAIQAIGGKYGVNPYRIEALTSFEHWFVQHIANERRVYEMYKSRRPESGVDAGTDPENAYQPRPEGDTSDVYLAASPNNCPF